MPERGSAGWRAVTRVLRSWPGWPCVGRWAATPAHDLANVLFPSDCRLCGDPLLHLSRVPVCRACCGRIAGISVGPLCSCCGDALPPESLRFAASLGITECVMCRLAPPEFTRAVAFAAYDDAARELLHLLKFQGVSAVASSLLGGGMGKAIAKLLPEMTGDTLVTPVPLFGARARSRGFNQAQLLAEAGLAHLRKAHPEWTSELRRDVLARVRDTRSSFAMAPHDRRANLRGAFRVTNADALKGREVLLIDDILTTGATARECARVLRRAGATRVWVATYARTFSEDAGPASVAMWSNPARASPMN